MASRTGSRLASAFLGYLIGVVLLVTLVPFDFVAPHHIRIFLHATLADFLANVAMFVPLGFLYRLTRPAAEDRWAAHPLIAGLGFSFLLESGQLLLRSRYSSPFDVLANGAGAWVGALALDQISRRLRPSSALVGALALELPLMGLIYLLIPLLWLSGLAAAEDPSRLILSALLGIAGALVIGAIHRHRLAPTGATTLARVATLGGAWFLVGALPGLGERPMVVLASALLVAAAVGVAGRRRQTPGESTDRRFEGRTLCLVAPVLGIYLVGIASWPPWSSLTSWHGEPGMQAALANADTVQILRLLEHFAAFTVLGYVVAESQGRREQALRQSIPRVLGWGCCVAIALEMLASVHAGAGGSLLRAGLSVLTALHGAGIYHLQRDHIRHLLRASPSHPALRRPPGIPPNVPIPRQSERTEAPASAARTG